MDSITQQGPMVFETVQNTAGFMEPAHSLISHHNTDDSIGGFECHFVSHTWDRREHFQKPHFSSNFFPKIL